MSDATDLEEVVQEMLRWGMQADTATVHIVNNVVNARLASEREHADRLALSVLGLLEAIGLLRKGQQPNETWLEGVTHDARALLARLGMEDADAAKS